MNAYRSYRSTEMHMYINNLEDFSNENNNVVFCSKMRSRVYECHQKYAKNQKLCKILFRSKSQ